MLYSGTLPGCCVSAYFVLDKENDLKDLARYFGSASVSIVVCREDVNNNIVDAFVKCDIPFEKLGNGQVIFTSIGTTLRDACLHEEIKNILEFEKREKRKRGELRIGDIIDTSGYIRGSKGRVVGFGSLTSGGNKNVTFSIFDVPKGYEDHIGRERTNYGSGYPTSSYPVILPNGGKEDNDK